MTPDNYTSQTVCETSGRTKAPAQFCSQLPSSQCDGSYVCDAEGKNCNPCQNDPTMGSSHYRTMGATSISSSIGMCMPLSSNCHNPIGRI